MPGPWSNHKVYSYTAKHCRDNWGNSVEGDLLPECGLDPECNRKYMTID